MNPMNKEDTTQAFKIICEEAEARRKASKERPLPRITIGMATCGLASGALETKQSFEQTLREENIEASIHAVGCIGHCYAEPVVIIDYAESGFPPLFYQQVTPGKARMLVKSFWVVIVQSRLGISHSGSTRFFPRVVLRTRILV